MATDESFVDAQTHDMGEARFEDRNRNALASPWQGAVPG